MAASHASLCVYILLFFRLVFVILPLSVLHRSLRLVVLRPMGVQSTCFDMLFCDYRLANSVTFFLSVSVLLRGVQ